MRSVWFRCLGCIGALTLSLAMLAVNYAFEAAGSIPDVETCGFLAGSSAGLLIIYPLTAALVINRITLTLARTFPERRSSLSRLGRDIAFAGSLLYLTLGLAVTIGRHGAYAVPVGVFALVVLYAGLAAAAGWLAAVRALSRMDKLTLQAENS